MESDAEAEFERVRTSVNERAAAALIVAETMRGRASAAESRAQDLQAEVEKLTAELQQAILDRLNDTKRTPGAGGSAGGSLFNRLRPVTRTPSLSLPSLGLVSRALSMPTPDSPAGGRKRSATAAAVPPASASVVPPSYDYV